MRATIELNTDESGATEVTAHVREQPELSVCLERAVERLPKPAWEVPRGSHLLMSLDLTAEAMTAPAGASSP